MIEARRPLTLKAHFYRFQQLGFAEDKSMMNKNFSYLVPHLPTPTTPYAKECMEKIKAMLAAPEREEPIERIVGEDDE